MYAPSIATVEARRFDIHFLWGSFIPDCMPVYPGALPDLFPTIGVGFTFAGLADDVMCPDVRISFVPSD